MAHRRDEGRDLSLASTSAGDCTCCNARYDSDRGIVAIQVEPAPDHLAYRVDALARITFVNERWDDFARQNGAPELAGGAIIGRLMHEFISDAETWHLYELLVRHAQRVGRPFTLRFRCDAPDAQRFMQMRIATLDDGQIEFQSRALEIRRRAALAVLTTGARRDASRLLSICSWCNRGKVDHQWMEIDQVVTTLGLFEGQPLPRLTHGVCDNCLARVKAEFLSA